MRFVVIRMLDSEIGIFEKFRTHEIVSFKCKWLRACHALWRKSELSMREVKASQ